MMNEIIEFLKKPITIIFIGAIIGVIGTAIVAIGTYLHNKGSSEKSSNILSGVKEGLKIGQNTGSNVLLLKAQNIELIGKVEGQEKTIDELRRENTDLYSKLNEASITIFNHVKGGLGPTYLVIDKTDSQRLRTTILNENEYSVFGARIDVIDYDEIRQCKGGFVRDKANNRVYVVDESCLAKYLKHTDIAELIVGRTLINHADLGMNKIATQDYGRFQISIRSRYTSFVQQLVFKKVNNLIYTTSRLLEVDVKPLKNVNDVRKIEIIRVVESDIKEWKIDFDKEFPTGLVDFSDRFE